MYRKVLLLHSLMMVMWTLCAVGMTPLHAADDAQSWHFYADTTVHPQADDSFAAVYADFTRMLSRDLQQENALLDENSIRVAPLTEGKPGAFVPVRFVKNDQFDAANKAIGTVIFLVAGTNETQSQTYRVFFDIQKNGPKTVWQGDDEVPDSANMIWNGGFEILSETYTGSNRYKNTGSKLPIGWWGNLKNSGITENSASDSHGGKYALAFGAPKDGKNIGIGGTPSPPGLRVVPGENYHFSLWVKGFGLTPSKTAVLSSLYWYDKDGKYLSRTRVSDLPANVTDFSWTKAEISLPAPAEAYFASQRIVTYSPTGSLTVDDFEARVAVPPALRSAKTNS